MICDGGGPFRVPVEACRDLGADFVIAVDIPAFEETRFSTGPGHDPAQQHHRPPAPEPVRLRDGRLRDPAGGDRIPLGGFRRGRGVRARGYEARRRPCPN